MENPDAYRAGKDLIEFTWQQNHMNSCKCFSLKFYRENDMPLLTGRFLSRENGETRESGTDAFSNPVPWQLTWVQWFDLLSLLSPVVERVCALMAKTPESLCAHTAHLLRRNHAHGSSAAGIRMPLRMLEYSHRNHSPVEAFFRSFIGRGESAPAVLRNTRI